MTKEIEELEKILASINPTTEFEAKQVVKDLCSFVNTVEDKIAELAVKHEVDAYISGPYGASRWVNHEGDDYYGIDPGEWQASAQSC